MKSQGTSPGSQHFGGRRACWSSRIRIRKNDKQVKLTWTCINQTTSQLMHSQSTFGAWTSHGQTQIHKTPHSPDQGKPPPSPLQYSLCLATRPAPKCHFVPRLQNGSFEIPKIRTSTTLEAHNFVCRPPIEERFEAKLQPSSRTFQRYVTHHLHTRKSGRFPTFNGQKS